MSITFLYFSRNYKILNFQFRKKKCVKVKTYECFSVLNFNTVRHRWYGC